MRRADIPPEDMVDVRIALGLAAVLFLAAVLLSLYGCGSCEPIARTEYQPYPVPLTRPCQVPPAPVPPADPVIPEDATEADVILTIERAWESWRAWGLQLWELYQAIPGDRVQTDEPPPG